MIRLTSLPALAALAAAALWIGPASAQQSGRSAPTADCPKGVLTLNLLKPQGNLNPPHPAVMEKWQAANKCTKIEVSEVPFGQFADKVSVVAASDNPPDILTYDGPNTQSYAAAGILLALDPYLPPGVKDDIIAPTLTEHSYEGKLYSPGIQQVMLGLYYNADMTDNAGITPPKTLATTWTWPQAVEAFKKCQTGPADSPTVWGLAPSRFGNGTPGFVYRDLLFLRSAGDPKAPKDSSLYKTFWAMSPDAKTADGWLNTSEAAAAAKVYQDMFSVQQITSKAGIPNAFQDKKACFTIDTSALAAGLTANNPGFRWGVTPLPYFKTPIVHTGSVTVGVMAKTKYPEEAAKFVFDVTTGPLLEEYAKIGGILPVMKSLYPKLPALKEYPFSLFVEALQEWGQPRPPSPKFAQYDKIVTDALRDIAYGADPKQRLDQAVATLAPILRR